MCLLIDGSTSPASSICFAAASLAMFIPVPPVLAATILPAGNATAVPPDTPVLAEPSAAAIITSSIALPIAYAAAFA